MTLKDSWAKIEKKQPRSRPPKKAGEESAEDEGGSRAPPAEIGIEEFGKVDLRVGLVKEAGLVEGADKLIRVMVDLGEGRDCGRSSPGCARAIPIRRCWSGGASSWWRT